MKSNNFIQSIVLISFIFFGIIGQSCQQDYESSVNNPEMTISPELENYIIAASDLYQSLRTFENELSKLDFSSFETVMENGRMVKYLPNFESSHNIDERILLLNQEKERLHLKYPQINTQKQDFFNLMNHCISRSTKINDFFINKNINFFLPHTKAVIGEYSFDSPNALVGYLYNWVLSSDYVEVTIYFFTDGTNMVMLDDRNTVGSSVAMFDSGGSYGNYYYDGKKIMSVAHSHMSSNQPSDLDYDLKNKYQGIGHAIYYNGAFHYY